ncbi:uncharacterized protein LOC126660614 [Mercurialis annua]|uniref:uncharacterized protein LOC126660614 n=1 Tax=Mercurialis annua TaxID=3986 RepID=UPI00216079CC|nr:uncharacterized protein LOC126660614 [Mercurialis annua]
MAIRVFSWLQCLLILLFLAKSISCSPIGKIPRLGVISKHEAAAAANNFRASEELQTYYYNQTLDHFNYQPQGYETFQQKYVISYKHWRGGDASAPIFAYMGEEAPLDEDIGGIGFLYENAPRFGALNVFIEHRFYGDSIPFVSREEALANATLRGYFSSAQALADYAEILLHIKKQLSADTSPIIVVGGSYGGMLASWFRLKYPHIALGALASSAPILYFDNLTRSDAYYSVVTKDFRDTSESCLNTIQQSWSELARVADQQDGLSILSKKFNTCTPLENASDLENYLIQIFSAAAQYDRPPRNQVSQICKGIDNAANGSDILDKIFSGVESYFSTKRPCYNLTEFWAPETIEGWNWQVCSELVIPIGADGNDTIFPAAPFDMNQMNDYCFQAYGVLPRPHWITSYYGGYHIREVLKRFGSNIIFSNGLRDPYSSGGVLQDISDTIVSLSTVQGSHCMDLLPTRKDDPEWLVLQRNTEIEIISGWILKYYQDLLQNNF